MQLIASVVVFAAVITPSLAQAQNFKINSPASCAQCAPCLFSWTETPELEPYIVNIFPPGQTGGPPMVSPATVNNTAVTFTCPFPPNTQFTFGLTDNQGGQQFTSPINVVQGPTTSCSNNTASPFSGASVSSSGGGSSGGSTSGSPSSGSSSSPSSSGSSGASASSTSPSGGSKSSTSSSSSPTTSTSTTPKSDAATISTSLFGFISVLVAALIA